MVETIKKHDFIELAFVGKIKETGEIFDTNVEEEIKKIKSNFEAKPYLISVGHSMTIKGLDNDLEGKEVGKEYTSEFKPEDAFGKRNPSLIRMIPIKLFLEQQIMPQKGMQLSLDGSLVKIVSVSGGRVLVDSNNPLAGKVVSYKYRIVRKITDEKEKVNALQDFFFRKKFDFDLKEKDLTFKVEKNLQKFVEVMANPFKEILGLNVKCEIVEKK